MVVLACNECKRRGFVCVLVAKGEPCLGPVTRTGCGALCPGFGRACYGCFGPSRSPNTESMTEEFRRLGLSRNEAADRFRFINGWAPDLLVAAAGDLSDRHAPAGSQP